MPKFRSKKIAEKTIYATFIILQEAGGEMRGKEVVDKIRDTLEFDDYEKHRFEKTGNIRWNQFCIFIQLIALKPVF